MIILFFNHIDVLLNDNEKDNLKPSTIQLQSARRGTYLEYGYKFQTLNLVPQ